MINKYVDLHTHSTCSDGTYTPVQLAEYAAAKGISAIALTDHDTVSGNAEFGNACVKLGIEAVSGVEISADYKTEMHIVGLFIDINNLDLCNKLSALKNSRLIRNKKMIDILDKSNMSIDIDYMLSLVDSNKLQNVGRPHFAAAMVKEGYVESVAEAFDKYLSKGKICYVKRDTFSPKECIEMIKNAGGTAILAHPVYITKDKSELSELLNRLKCFGLDGVECFYSAYTEDFSEMCIELCNKLDLLPSGGSDFHGMNKKNIDLGMANVPYSVFENLKNKTSRG